MEVKTCYILIYFVVVAIIIIITFCEFISIPDLKISIFNIHCWDYYGIVEHLAGAYGGAYGVERARKHIF